jgi:hypothetical protein
MMHQRSREKGVRMDSIDWSKEDELSGEPYNTDKNVKVPKYSSLNLDLSKVHFRSET